MHIENIGFLPRLAIAFIIAASSVLLGQTGASHQIGNSGAIAPVFEVATIKLSDPKNDESYRDLGDKVQMKGQTVKELVKFAYDLNFGSDQQLSGGPDWIRSTKFDVDAKEEESVAAALKKLPRNQQLDQIRLQVRAMLEDRFKLKVHHETKVLTVYQLITAKNGSKLKPSSPPPADSSKPPAPQMEVNPIMGRINGNETTPDVLAHILAILPEVGDRIVIDKTGLTGKYDFKLQYTPDSGTHAPPPDASGPDLFTALQEQLGLKLELAKSPIDTIVIDHVEMPSEN